MNLSKAAGNLFLAGTLAMSQPGCNHRDPKDIQTIESLNAQLEATECECTARIDACKFWFNACMAAAGAERSANDEAKKEEEASRLQNEKAEMAKAVLRDKLYYIIEEAKISNPTNKYLIRQLFAHVLGGESLEGYEDFREALGAENMGRGKTETELVANAYSKTMDSGSIASDALSVFAKLDFADKMKIGGAASQLLPSVQAAATSYGKYEELFKNGTFENCPNASSIWTSADKQEYEEYEKKAKEAEVDEETRAGEDDEGEAAEPRVFDVACEKDGLADQYHKEPELDRFIMRLMARLHVPAKVMATTAKEAMETISVKQ